MVAGGLLGDNTLHSVVIVTGAVGINAIGPRGGSNSPHSCAKDLTELSSI